MLDGYFLIMFVNEAYILIGYLFQLAILTELRNIITIHGFFKCPRIHRLQSFKADCFITGSFRVPPLHPFSTSPSFTPPPFTHPPPPQVTQYRGGKKKLFNFLVGRVRMEMGGRVDGHLIDNTLKELLHEKQEDWNEINF